MLLLKPDPSSSIPVYLQIRDRVVALIEEGTLGPGDRLPTTRGFAASIGVHRSTVVRAYDELRALGCLESRRGSYSTVRRRVRLPATSTQGGVKTEPESTDWLQLATETVRRVHGFESRESPARTHHEAVDFERLAADPKLAPTADLRRSLKRVLHRLGPEALDYTDPMGWRPLRETISARLRSHGVVASADDVLITSGAQHALDLSLRLLTRPRDRVVVSAPTYGMAHALLRLHGIEPIEVPMLENGMDLDALEGVLARTETKLVYTMPNFHNPTGVTTDQAHRERLLALCESRQTPLLEDGFEEEMKYFGQAVLPIKSMDAQGLVLYVGTFSKVVFPGLRLGWIAASRKAIELLASIQHASCLAANTLAQVAADRFCYTGDFESHLRRLHRIYRLRMSAMLGGLKNHLPSEVRCTKPAGGYTLWVTLPQDARDERFWCDRFYEAGVKVAPGSRFFGAPCSGTHFRLSISCVDEAEIEEGCRRTGEVLAANL